MRHYLLAPLIAGLSGCVPLDFSRIPTRAGYERMLDSWVGVQEVDLVRNWGAPDQVHEAGGHRFIGYAAKRKVHHSGTPTTVVTVIKDGSESTTTTDGTPDYVEERLCKTTFELESSKVVAWSFQGNDCVAPGGKALTAAAAAGAASEAGPAPSPDRPWTTIRQ
jgi:hypothetical protein